MNFPEEKDTIPKVKRFFRKKKKIQTVYFP